MWGVEKHRKIKISHSYMIVGVISSRQFWAIRAEKLAHWLLSFLTTGIWIHSTANFNQWAGFLDQKTDHVKQELGIPHRYCIWQKFRQQHFYFVNLWSFSPCFEGQTLWRVNPVICVYGGVMFLLIYVNIFEEWFVKVVSSF